MKRIAIISDIHGNLVALKTVLKDIKTKNIDIIICLGDIIGKGTHSKECIKLIRENCSICLMGNWEYNLFHEKTNDNIEFLRQLTPEETNFLKDCPYSYEMLISGNLVRFVHSSPDSFNDYIFNFSPLNSKYNLFLPSNKTVSPNTADILIYGHIHYQYVDTIYNRILINAGAVGNSLCLIRDKTKDGNSRNITKACYLIIEGELFNKEISAFSYQFVQVPYDVNLELENITSDIYLKNELLNGEYRDSTKLKKFLEKNNT